MENFFVPEDEKGLTGDNKNNLPAGKGTADFSDSGKGSAGSSRNAYADGAYFSKGLLGARELMNVSWKMVVERFAKFITLTLLIIAVFFVAFVAFVVFAMLVNNWIIAAAVGIPAIVLLLLFTMSAGIVTFEIAADKDIRIRDAFGRSFSKLPSYFKAVLAYIAFYSNIFLIIFLLMLSGIFYIAIATAFLSISNEIARAVLGISGWMTGMFFISSFAAVMLASILISAFKNFLLFSVVLDNRPVIEGMASAFSLVRKGWKTIAWNLSVFFAFYAAVLLPMFAFTDKSSIVMLVYQIAVFIFNFWMLMFFYAMFRNLKAVYGAGIDPKNIAAVKAYVKVGAICLVIIFEIYFVLIFLALMASSNPESDIPNIPQNAINSNGVSYIINGLF